MEISNQLPDCVQQWVGGPPHEPIIFEKKEMLTVGNELEENFQQRVLPKDCFSNIKKSSKFDKVLFMLRTFTTTEFCLVQLCARAHPLIIFFLFTFIKI